jgi:hypothetical protein
MGGSGSGWVAVAGWQWRKNERNRSSIGGDMVVLVQVGGKVAVAVAVAVVKKWAELEHF